MDLVFVGVEHLALPTVLRGLEVTSPTEADLARANELRAGVQPGEVHVLLSEGHRHLVIAAVLRVLENDLDIFESPLESFGRR